MRQIQNWRKNERGENGERGKRGRVSRRRGIRLAPIGLLGMGLIVAAVAGCSTSRKEAAWGSRSVASETSLIRSDYEAGEITRLCEAALKETEARLDQVAQVPAAERKIETTLLEFEDALSDFGDTANALTFMGYVAQDEALRKEGSACEEKVGQFYVSIFTRRDLYEAVKAVKGRSPDETRLVSETVEAFERNGLKLSDKKLAEVKRLMTELSAKETKFAANLNNDTSTVEFTEAELQGVPADAMSRFEKTADGRFAVTTKSTDYVALAENASHAETRRRILFAYLNRGGPENTKLLEEATVLRSKIARLLGYKTWADYRTADRMAESRANVLEFLNGLKSKLARRNRDDLAKLLMFKKELEPEAQRVEQWDVPYLSYQLKKRDYNLDNEKIREYFPADVVIRGLFEVYSKLLGVHFEEAGDARTWSDDVKLYKVRDAGDGKTIAYFYTDFFPRPGKYGHAAAFTLVSGRRLTDGGYKTPVSSIVANFTPPSGEKPSLLTHDEVETVFHEFGHIMHQTLTRAPFASLSGSSVARDFVEAPSQMLENWVWEPEILELISGHYQNHAQKLPGDLLKQMLAARDFNQGITYTRQLLYGLFDMTIHSRNKATDVTRTYDKLFRQIAALEPIEGGHFPGTFGHMMGGYDSGYYGYLWSEVYAQDMYSVFKAGGLLNADLGRRYRENILEPGSMKESIDLLKGFLRREPSQDAFFKKLRIEESKKPSPSSRRRNG